LATPRSLSLNRLDAARHLRSQGQALGWRGSPGSPGHLCPRQRESPAEVCEAFNRHRHDGTFHDDV